MDNLPTLLNSLDDGLIALRNARLWIEQLRDPEELNGALAYLEAMKTSLKVQKIAENIAIEASRLQVVAFRRLGQLEKYAPGILRKAKLGNQQVTAARDFAEMPDAEFEDLLGSIATIVSPVGLWRAYKRVQDEQECESLGYRIGSGQEEYPEVVAPRELAEAARTVLAAAFDNHYKVASVPAASVLVAEALDIYPDFEANAAVRKGLRTAIRESLHQDFSTDVITYKDASVGWIHVAFEAASVQQVFAWDDFRGAQTEYVNKAYAGIHAIAKRVAIGHKKFPEIRNAAEVLKALEHDRGGS